MSVAAHLQHGCCSQLQPPGCASTAEARGTEVCSSVGAGLSMSQGALLRSRAGGGGRALRSTVWPSESQQHAEIMAKQEVAKSLKPQSRSVASKRAQFPSTTPPAMSVSIPFKLIRPFWRTRSGIYALDELVKGLQAIKLSATINCAWSPWLSLSAPASQGHQTAHFANKQPKLCHPPARWWSSLPLS